jgi:hypothetical protein
MHSCMCALTNSQSFIRSTGNHKLGSGTRLKSTDTKNLPKQVKVALRTMNKVAQSPDELMKWIKDLNPEFHKEHAQ